jgi:hypothetical protein
MCPSGYNERASFSARPAASSLPSLANQAGRSLYDVLHQKSCWYIM